MAYSDQALLSVDADFINRIGASAAVELEPSAGYTPDQWARNNAWWIAASPGFADAYASALAGGVIRPGNDPAVITDGMILASVQALIAELNPPPPEQPPPPDVIDNELPA
jgi:hypothetical protein